VRGTRQRERLLELVERNVALRRADRRDQQQPGRACLPRFAELGIAVEFLQIGARHRDWPGAGRMRHAARGREREHAVGALEQGGQGDEIGRRYAIEDQGGVPVGIGSHVLQREGLRRALEALEERHVAREMRHVLGRDAAAAIHAREVIHAVLAVPAHPLADDSACSQHPHDLLVRALEDAAPRVAHDWIERIAETVGFQYFFSLHIGQSTFAPASFTTLPHFAASAFT
jgi:hypothetical protein